MNRLPISALAAAALIALLAGCGGGGSNTSGGGGGSQTVSISAITGPPYLQIGVTSPTTYVYSAKVTGGSDQAVIWSVSDPSLVTIDSTTGVVTPAATGRGSVTITATAHADSSKKSTTQVNVVDWLLADYAAYLVIEQDGSYLPWGSLLPTTSGDEQCSWSHDHLKFICFNGSAADLTTWDVFTTDGTKAGTKAAETLDLSSTSGLLMVGSWSPRYSPDGTQIVFLGSAFSGLDMLSGPMVVDAAGKTTPKLLAQNTEFIDMTNSSPRFTPDGKQVLWAQSSGLWIVNADGSNPHMLVPAPATQGLFAPDMSALYYASNGCIYKANIDGTAPVCVFSGNVVGLMDISPNGEELVYLGPAEISTTGGNIYVVNADGTNSRQTGGLDWASW